MHFMESASRVEYARTLAGVVVLDAIKPLEMFWQQLVPIMSS